MPHTVPTSARITVRELARDEDDVLDAVFAGLSPTSRLHRFLGPVPDLLPPVRRALLAVDGRAHLAVAAFAGRDPIGIARLVREAPGRAELAVEVVDAWQHRGIGARLVRAVLARGREAGVVEVVADVMAENAAALGLRRALAPGLAGVRDGHEIRFVAHTTELGASSALPAAA
ncbi:MAG TPA: GNAT family N-acetyltransferase [Actinomycetospora sp.]|uniref:GNAT family N-acetyltransferase n=1 Tax=Actinomycetospora sp. TaxID=1872135 RepID=UPI002F3EF19C